MKKIFRLSGFLLGITLSFALLNSCMTTSTVITGSWEKPDVDQNYDNIMVAALVPSIHVRSMIEMQMVENLNKKDVDASQSSDILPPRFIEDIDRKREILDAIKNNGSDGILTVTLIDKETETRYVPGASPYAPYPRFGFYGTFWGYYNHWYPFFYDRGYYATESIYFIETNLYDAETENLIWSAQSRTYEPASIGTFSEDLARAVVKQLSEENLI